MTTATQKAHDFEEIEALLPWYAAGTLNRRDTARVDQALATDRELAARFELVREELGDTIGLNESLGAPSARARDKLFAMIDAEPARKPVATFNPVAWMSGLLASLQPRTLAYGATAAAFALVLQAGVMTGLVFKERQAAHELASYTSEEKAQDGSYMLVRFQPQASVHDVAEFLSEFKGSVVSGPAPGGLFRIQVSEKSLTKDELADVVKRATQSPLVGLALPVAAP